MTTTGSGSTSVVKQRTVVHVTSAKFEWQIAKFDNLMKLWNNAKKIVSQKFCASTVPDILWELHVYPKGTEDSNNVNCASIFLYQQQVGRKTFKKPISAKFSIFCSAPSTQITRQVIQSFK